MSDLGRQLKPVKVTITGGDDLDRSYWGGRLQAWLVHQPCVTHTLPTSEIEHSFNIYPDANNE